MSGQSWTPAPKWGIVPLHPMDFGMILGKSFSALRHNPKVLFGFAVLIQLVVVGAATFILNYTLVAAALRLDSLSVYSPDFEAILAGTLAWTLIASFLVGLASSALTAIVQGVVAADIGYAAVGEKATLRQIWRRMRPAIWRLLAFSLLLALFGFGLIAATIGIGIGFAAGLLGTSPAAAGIGILVAVLAGLAAIPLAIWLGTKLLLVPSVLVLESTTLREAMVRSWRLTRGRFWFALGLVVVVNVIMTVAALVMSIPAELLSSFLSDIMSPTGSPGTVNVLGVIVGEMLPQLLVIVVQAVGAVVGCTVGVLVHIDCRMRYEGLDQTLLTYLERRDQGASEQVLSDPFAVDPLRAVPAGARPIAPVPRYGPPPAGYGAPPGYPHPGYGPPGQYAPPPGYYAPPGYAPPSGFPPAPGYAPMPPGSAAPGAPGVPTPPYAPAPEAPASDAPEPSPTWTAPGSDSR